MNANALTAYAALNLTLGGALALLMASPLAAWALDAMSFALPEGDATEQGVYTRLAMGIAGGVWAGWGVTMLGASRGWAPSWSILAGLCTWYLLDGAATIACGAWTNLVGNTTFLALGLAAARLSTRR